MFSVCSIVIIVQLNIYIDLRRSLIRFQLRSNYITSVSVYITRII